MNAATQQQCGAVARNLPGACILGAGHDGRHRDAEGLTWQHEFKHGRPDVYEITWMSGHVERVLAHQVSYPHAGLAMAADILGMGAEPGAPRVRMHAEIDGQWRLVLAAREEDIRTLRLATADEPIPGGTS